jgi:tol-pal system protein YbgF
LSYRPSPFVLVTALALAALAPGAVAQDAEEGSTAELSIRLQILEDELRDLRGELEIQRFRTRELQRQLNEVREAQGLEPASPAAPAAPGTAGDPARGGDGRRTSDAGTDGARAGGERTLDGDTAGPAAVVDTPTLEGEPTRRRDEAPTGGTYDRGLALLQAGQYADARREFEGFVAANPQDPRAPEAAFWAAETLFVEGEYQEAAAAFAQNYRSFGAQAPRAPDSLLKVALSLIELGDKQRACRTLQALELRHTDLSRSLETAAERARERADC